MEIEIIKYFQSLKTPLFDAIMWIFTTMASIYFVILLFIFLYFFSKKKYSFIFIICTAFNVGINYLLKIIINRKRPYEISSEIINVTNSLGKSMPSGHMVCATTIVIFLLLIFWKKLDSRGKKSLAIIFGIIFLLLVGVSRMYFGQHYPTDLIAGVGVGTILTVCEIFILRRLYKQKKV